MVDRDLRDSLCRTRSALPPWAGPPRAVWTLFVTRQDAVRERQDLHLARRELEPERLRRTKPVVQLGARRARVLDVVVGEIQIARIDGLREFSTGERELRLDRSSPAIAGRIPRGPRPLQEHPRLGLLL